MKLHPWFHILIAAWIISSDTATAQVQLLPIPPETLHIADDQTVSLLFPYPIQSVDLGTRDLLVQMPPGMKNLLHIKAARKDFTPTSLTVVTAEGTLFTFAVSWAEKPVLALQVVKDGKVASAQFSTRRQAWEAEATAAWIAEREKPRRLAQKRQDGLVLRLTGLYLKNDLLYYRLRVVNRSPVGFDFGGLRFLVRAKRKVRRGAVQEEELIPVYTHGNTQTLAGNSESVLVYALPKHHLPKQKYLAVDLTEALRGDRQVPLRLRARTLRRVLPITGTFELAR
ncbi:conjugative transposon protein TraN [Rhabdobacter roseus]|uniref:Conjugative transposon TraN protein n=1 Tax=Rhabdobacter roseus TaxID=1655419 RepID=A0A840U3F8_9BACT|nr:DUF4138 domain-containing protein [Rhabdobacter roseus]MBB5286650.1 conjugative transposon TraN protein [Rhabdobacter roseus]